VSAAIGLKRLAIAGAAIVAGGFGALIAVSMLIPADTVRDAVQAEIRAVTGLDPVLRGNASVSLFPSGTVSFDNVSLGDNRSGAPALVAEQVVARLRFLPFLIGRIQIADVSLIRPTIAVTFASDGTSNWSRHIEMLADSLKSGAGRLASFSEIRIGDGTVIVRDEANRLAAVLTNVEFALAWPSISRSFAATGRFAWRNETVDATISLSDFVAALSGERSGLKIRLAGAPLKFAFDGTVSHRPVLKLDGTLAADATSLRETLRWAGHQAPPGGGFERFALKAQASVSGSNVALSAVNIELDGNAGEGVLSFAGDGRQTLQGTLAAEHVDLTHYVSTVRLLTGSERDWNRQPIALDGLDGVDVDLRLSAQRVTIAHVKLGRTAVAANLRNGHLTVAVGESQAFGGVVQGTFGLAKASGGADMKAQLQFTEVDLEQCLGEMFGMRRLAGKGTFGFTLDSKGSSVLELTQGLNGNANLVSRKGAITGFNVEQMLRRLERNPLSGRGDLRTGKTPYDLITVQLKIAQGIAHVQDTRVEGPAVRLQMGGSASIPNRDFDLKGNAALLSNAGGAATPAFELPFFVRGPWDDPLYLPDAQILINRSGAAAPLIDAVRSRLRRPSDPAPAEAPPEAAPQAAPPAPAGPDANAR
jgi:AsmA protein